MRLVFAGTPDAAVPSLHALAESGHEIARVVSRADAPLGRRRVLTPSPVARAAEEHGFAVLKTNRLDAGVTEELAALEPDLGVIVAYGGLVRQPLLQTPRLGWINLHFSLLPRWRGAAPVQRAVIAGDILTGAVVFQLVPELDAGPVYGTIMRPIGPEDTAGLLLGALSMDGAGLLTSVVNDLAAGTARSLDQVGTVTLAPKLTIDDARIDWTEPVDVVNSRVRGVTPEPGAFTVIGDARLKLLEVEPAPDAPVLSPGVIRQDGSRLLVGTGSGALALARVQPAGKNPMDAADWWRGIAALRRGAEELVAS